MKTVMFDVDGVLADFVYGFSQEAHRLFGTPIIHTEEQPSWNFQHILTKAQENQTWESVKRTPYWWETLRPMADAGVFKRIHYLHNRANVVFVTSRVSNVDPPSRQTQRWLYNRGISQPNVVVTNKKGDVAKAIGASWSIEDKAENAWCVHWISDKPQTKSFLIDRPYNQDHPHIEIGAKGVIRIKTVHDYLDVVEREL